MNVESSCLGFLSAKITFLNLFKAQFSYLKQNRAICEASNPSEIYLHHINHLFYSFAKTSETVIRITRRKEESERVDWDREEGVPLMRQNLHTCQPIYPCIKRWMLRTVILMKILRKIFIVIGGSGS